MPYGKKGYDMSGAKGIAGYAMSVPMEPAGNVVGGKYSADSDKKSMSRYNTASNKTRRVAGSHRKTMNPGKVKGHHRAGY